ncbi:MAG: sugar phosphate isomerase/epimerase [Hungatella sp.]|nr:sugar phosphate isomerase/epimerase [Hungatella sp.]
MNKLGINLWNWQTGLCEECAGLVLKAADMGFTAVELPMTRTDVPEIIEREIRLSGLCVSLCAALGPGKDLSSFDPQIRNHTMDYVTECLKAGEKLGACVLCGPLYAGGGKRHRLSPGDQKREWDLAVTGLREAARRAGECGMELSVEPLNRYRTSVVNTAAQAAELVRDIGADNVGIHFDTYHACLEERDLLEALEEALKSSRVNHFHACANNRGGPGQGLVPWKEVFRLLVKYGYKGHITMETFAPGGLDSSWVQVHGDADETALMGIGYLKGIFRELLGKEAGF